MIQAHYPSWDRSLEKSGDGETTNEELPLAIRVATVQNDVNHMSNRIGRVEVTLKETRDELKSDIARVESGIDEVKSELKTELGNSRKALYALCIVAALRRVPSSRFPERN